MASRRAALPLKPLYEIARVRSDNPVFTNVEFAEAIGTTSRAVDRWMNEKGGWMPWTSADEASIALGLHPVIVWGDDWLNVKGDFDKLAAEAVRDLERQVIDGLVEESME